MIITGKSIDIKRPLLWLFVAAIGMYLPSAFFGLTRLDDFFLIARFQHYNSHMSSLATSFTRGVFGMDDNYYRPVFMDSMMVNSWIAGGSVATYHVINMLLHGVAVMLLFQLLVELHVARMSAFVLSVLVAIHPALVQAVAWIPGRNDTLMAVFSYAFFIAALKYAASGSARHLILSVSCLMLALFTKEAGIVALPVVLVLQLGVRGGQPFTKRMFAQYACWFGCVVIWFLMRSGAAIRHNNTSVWLLVKEFSYKAPLILHYIGKLVFPVNLSVFPTIRDTPVYQGLLALTAVAAILVFSRTKNMVRVACGIIVFMLYIMPILLVPHYMSPNIFEHRLYLPVLGFVLLLPETFLFHNSLSQVNKAAIFAGLCFVLIALNLQHQKNFANPQAFWSQAVRSSPTSAYAHIMLAMQVTDNREAHSLYRKALDLNPRERNINYNIALILQREDSVLASEPYLLAEKARSDYYMCDYYLARVAFVRGDYPAAGMHYRNFVARVPNFAPTDRAAIMNNPAWNMPDSLRGFLARHLKL